MTIRKPKLTDEERANSTVISIRLEKVQERWLTIESGDHRGRQAANHRQSDRRRPRERGGLFESQAGGEAVSTARHRLGAFRPTSVTCVQCGKAVIEVKPLGAVPKRCEPCNAERRLAQKRVRHRGYYRARREDPVAVEEDRRKRRTPEYRAYERERSRRRLADPAFRQAERERRRRYREDPAIREREREYKRKRRLDPAKREAERERRAARAAQRKEKRT